MKPKIILLVIFLSVGRIETVKMTKNSKNRKNRSSVGETSNSKQESINFDQTLLSADDKVDGVMDRKTIQTESVTNVPKDEIFLNDILGKLRHKEVDIDAFVQNLDELDCAKFNGDQKDPKNVLCEGELAISAFAPLGETYTDHNTFFEYLKKSIYEPLAQYPVKRTSLSDMVVDSYRLDPKMSVFYGEPVTTNYNKFEESVLKQFEKITAKSDDLELNKNEIGQTILDVLKRFHLYWNYLRHNNQIDKLKVDTKEMIRTIMRSFVAKRDFLDITSKKVIENLTTAYYKFLRAHKILQLTKERGPDLITAQFLKRYLSVAKLVKSSQINNIDLVKELASFMNMFQVFNIMSAKKGLSENQIVINYNKNIEEVLKASYANLVDKEFKFLSNEIQISLKHFTVTLLLKFKHLTFIMFTYNGISDYINMPHINYLKTVFSVKVYYELTDKMLLIPKTCEKAIILKGCVLQETIKNVKYVTDKYQIKRSTYGWFFLKQLSEMMKSLFKKADQQVWTNWDAFKGFYYTNLFATLFNYKSLFSINDMDCLTSLENRIGEHFKEMKFTYRMTPITYGLIDILDKQLYDEILSIKADYNSFAPIEENDMVLGYLKTRFLRFLDNYKKSKEDDMNEDVEKVVDELKHIFDQWISQMNTLEKKQETVSEFTFPNVIKEKDASKLMKPDNEVEEEEETDSVVEVPEENEVNLSINDDRVKTDEEDEESKSRVLANSLVPKIKVGETVNEENQVKKEINEESKEEIVKE